MPCFWQLAVVGECLFTCVFLCSKYTISFVYIGERCEKFNKTAKIVM